MGLFEKKKENEPSKDSVPSTLPDSAMDKFSTPRVESDTKRIPSEIVQEHRDQLAGLEEAGQEAQGKPRVIEGLFKDKKED